MFKIKTLLILLFISIAVLSAEAQSDIVIKFKKGESSASVSGGAPRGETSSYKLTAKKNQLMKVSISSTESNAVFKIKNLTTGYFLPNAGELDDASEWRGILPSSGDYRIIVGSTRGGTEFTVFVEID